MGLFHHHERRNSSAQDTQEARIEDTAYMLNHAVACTITDFFEAPLNTWFHNDLVFRLPSKIQPYLANFKFGCGCTGHHTKENHANHNVGTNASVHNALFAEFIADFGSVPLVLAAQQYFPNQMKAVEKAVEPYVGGALHKRAELSAKSWAKNRGISYDSEAYKQQVDEIYDHEMSHLPQAVLWTFSSLGIHAVGQKALGINAPWAGVISAKLMSSAVVFGAVVGTRFAIPGTMRKFDRLTTKHFVGPTTIALGDVVGLDKEVVRKFVKREERELAQETAFEKANGGKKLDAEDIQAIEEAKQEGQKLMEQERTKREQTPNTMTPQITVKSPTIEAQQYPEIMQHAT